jgi:hypothetical protein
LPMCWRGAPLSAPPSSRGTPFITADRPVNKCIPGMSDEWVEKHVRLTFDGGHGGSPLF